MARRGPAILAIVVLLVACGTGPVVSPDASTGSGSALAARLRDAMSVNAVIADLATLPGIARDNGGNRADGSPGYDASADFVEQTLRGLGYQVHRDTFSLPIFSEVGTPRVDIPGGPSVEAGRDFRPMIYSASGDVTAPVVAVGYQRGVDPDTAAEHPLGRGCAGDLPAEVSGAIVLVQAGACFRRAQVASAQQRHAAAIVVAYPQWKPGFVLRPTLLTPDGVDIPVLGATGALGDALADAADAGTSVHLQVTTRVEDRSVSSVIAETSGGDADHVVMLGGHLDTALEAPGINDNGSGTMAILEVARALSRIGPPPERVRFAFWAGEELGLFGSRHYVEGLSASDQSRIDAYLNFDMLASPNGGRLVYRDSGAAAGSATITSLFTDYFGSAGLSHEELDLTGGSDQVAFAEAGIPTGGLFSGANEPNPSEEVQRFGGTAHELFDACYHRTCDTLQNLNRGLLAQMLRAVGYVTGELASGQVNVRP